MEPGNRGVQERIESTWAGRAVISVLVLATLGAILVINLPESHLRRELSDVTQPYANAVGLDQAWGVFAPDPRRESLEIKATITYADGGTDTWKPPFRGAVIGGYSDYRWRKLVENAMVQGDGPLARDLALWVARRQRSRREAPVSVILIKRHRANPAPGVPADQQGGWAEDRLLELPITREELRSG